MDHVVLVSFDPRRIFFCDRCGVFRGKNTLSFQPGPGSGSGRWFLAVSSQTCSSVDLSRSAQGPTRVHLAPPASRYRVLRKEGGRSACPGCRVVKVVRFLLAGKSLRSRQPRQPGMLVPRSAVAASLAEIASRFGNAVPERPRVLEPRDRSHWIIPLVSAPPWTVARGSYCVLSIPATRYL